MTDGSFKDVCWHGDSLDVVREFPRSVRIDIGNELYLLQPGEQPLHSRPFASVGRGVREKTQKTRKSDIEIGKSRYRELQRKK